MSLCQTHQWAYLLYAQWYYFVLTLNFQLSVKKSMLKTQFIVAHNNHHQPTCRNRWMATRAGTNTSYDIWCYMFTSEDNGYLNQQWHTYFNIAPHKIFDVIMCTCRLQIIPPMIIAHKVTLNMWFSVTHTTLIIIDPHKSSCNDWVTTIEGDMGHMWWWDVSWVH